LAEFSKRLTREWSIETGQIEGVYNLDRGLTETLIEKGIDCDLIPNQPGQRPPEIIAAFHWYPWPGNIRELQNLVERAVILSRDGVLPNPLHKKQTELMIPSLHRTRTFHSSMTLEDSDRALILETLEQAGWIVGGPHGAAARLGLKRTTLLAKMRRFSISRPTSQEGTSIPGFAQEAQI